MPIGETFMWAALEPLFERLLSLGRHLVVMNPDLRKTLETWESELRMIEAVLVDVEHRGFQFNVVKNWMDDLQDLVFDMEDLLEEIEVNIKLRQQEFIANMDQQQDADQLCSDTHPGDSFFGALVPANMVARITNNLSNMFIGVDRDVQKQMEELTLHLKNFGRKCLDLDLFASNIIQQPALETEALRDKRKSSSLGSEVLGRDDEKQHIITQLLEDEQGDKNYVVISIVGMGGIGKTTLAQYAYNNEQVQYFFDVKAWVWVSDVFDVKLITTTIFKATVGIGTAVDFSTFNEAQTQLKQALKSKKFLLVLDDVWNEDYGAWDQLQEPFKDAATGSKVIMTTRNEKIAKMMMNTNPSHNNIINLKGLSDKDCWAVFQQHANSDSDLAELRDDVIKKCKGLPLAASALGGLLKRAIDMKERRMILESNTWSMETLVLPALRLSYYYLPSHLKRLFAYCSVLPKDYKFTEMEVILLWMAQDFLPQNKSQSMEDLGHSFFNDLVSRSLFEKYSNAKGTFIMHDVVHDLALWAAGKSCYVMDTKDIKQVDWRRIRHVFFSEDAFITLGSQIPMASQLRTFYCDDLRRIQNLDFINGFRLIRTLRLASDTIKVLPEYIGELKHLRFLELEFERIKELPQSISNLWNLQTLCLQGCYSLEKVPNIGSLEKLRHLKIGILKEMPRGFEKLTNLRSLDKFILGDGRGAMIRELEDINHLEGELQIYALENVSMVEDASKAQLKNKCRLDKLTLTWGIRRDEHDDSTERDVLKQLEPPSSIKKCNLWGYTGPEFPAWLGDACFKNMVDIELSSCMKCEWLPPLGQLPRLESLSIELMDGVKKVGTEFYGDRSNPFPTLKSLLFRYMKSWEKWEAGNDRAFPCLEYLEINGCDSLQEDVPTHLPSLKRLEIKNCKELRVLLPSLPLLEQLRLSNDKEKLILRGQSPSLKLIPFRDLSSEMPQCISRQSLFNFYSPEIQCFPQGALHKNPKALKITNVNIDQVPSLPSSLSKLHIQDCLELESFEDDSLPLQLTSLYIHKCPKLQFSVAVPFPLNLKALSIRNVLGADMSIREWGLHLLTSLERLDLQNVGYESGDCTEQVHRIPYDLELPSSLSELEIEGFQNLKSIGFSNLPNLRRLHIKRCPQFSSFEDTPLPRQLQCVEISECDLIRPRLKRDPLGCIRMDGDKWSLC